MLNTFVYKTCSGFFVCLFVSNDIKTEKERKGGREGGRKEKGNRKKGRKFTSFCLHFWN